VFLADVLYNTCLNKVIERPQARLLGVLHAAGTLETEVESRLSAIGLSMAKLAALYQLVMAGDSLPLGQLAERLSCVKSNVTQLVDRLESDGLVSREGDPSDRRSRLAVITPEANVRFNEAWRFTSKRNAISLAR